MGSQFEFGFLDLRLELRICGLGPGPIFFKYFLIELHGSLGYKLLRSVIIYKKKKVMIEMELYVY